MGKYLSKSLAIDQIREDFPFCCRYRPGNTFLENLIAKRGLLTPILVTHESNPAILSGHNRYQAARKAGIPEISVLQIQETLNPGDSFILAVLSNWNQNWPEIDRAWTLHQAKEKFHLPEREVMELILPALALPAEKYILEQYQDTARLDSSLLDLMVKNKLPFRGSQILARFSREDQKAFADLIASHAVLTSNQLLKLGEWLHDLLKKERLALSDFLGRRGLLEILKQEQTDSRQKAESLFAAVRYLRFPRLVEYEKKFQVFSQSLARESRDVKLEVPESFEAQGFTLHARIRNEKGLENVLEILEREKPSLNSLFDIML
ncbi:MAG: hypothetical protein HYZ83_03435 [Candidatus Omnitrophica bacterium]|nr:hypothetical protein [Candidatus Omnitrophota bacterium]